MWRWSRICETEAARRCVRLDLCPDGAQTTDAGIRLCTATQQTHQTADKTVETVTRSFHSKFLCPLRGIRLKAGDLPRSSKLDSTPRFECNTHKLSRFAFLCFLLVCQVATLSLACLTLDLGLYPERRGTLTSAGSGRSAGPPVSHLPKNRGNKQQAQASHSAGGCSLADNTRRGRRGRERSTRGDTGAKSERREREGRGEEKNKKSRREGQAPATPVKHFCQQLRTPWWAGGPVGRGTTTTDERLSSHTSDG